MLRRRLPGRSSRESAHRKVLRVLLLLAPGATRRRLQKLLLRRPPLPRHLPLLLGQRMLMWRCRTHP